MNATAPINLVIDALTFKQALQFISPAISNEETRYYLNGVYFDKRQGQQLQAVATCGHRLHKIALNAKESSFDDDLYEAGAEFSFIMPKATVAQIIKLIDKKAKWVELVIISATEVVFKCGTVEITFKPVEGKFPDYTRVIPNNDNPAIMQGYSANYLLDTFKAFTVFSKAIRVASFGSNDINSPIVFKADTPQGVEALAVVMPMRV